MKVFLHEGHHDHDGNHDHKHTHTHTHDGVEHTHEHTHQHTHDGAEHTHEEANLHDSAKDMATLKALIAHWIHHGEDHVGSYEEWVTKAKAHGKDDVAEALTRAIELLNKANESFRKAKELM